MRQTLAIIILFLSVPYFASAAVLLQQTTADNANNDNYSADGVGSGFRQTIDCADVDGTVTSVAVKANSGYDGYGAQGPADAKIVFNGTDSNTLEIAQGASWYDYTFTFSPGVACVPATGVVNMDFINVESDRLRSRGSTAGTYAGGSMSGIGGGTTVTSLDEYFVISGTATVVGYSPTYELGTTTADAIDRQTVLFTLIGILWAMLAAMMLAIRFLHQKQNFTL